MRIDWGRYHVHLTDVGRSRWKRGVPIDPTWAEDKFVRDFDLWFVWKGRGSIRLRSGRSGLRSGVCIWMRPGWRYDIEQDPDDPLCLTFVHFDLLDAAGAKIPPNVPFPPEYHEPPDPQLAEAVTRRIVEIAWGYGLEGMVRVAETGSAAVIGGHLLTGLLMELDAASDAGTTGGGLSGRQRRAIEQAACRIMESPREVPAVPELARGAGYSVDHFIRVFRQATGLTPQKFILQARTRLAQRLLRETEMTIGEVADAVGYHDIYYFSRHFKELAGASPSAFRNRLTDGPESTGTTRLRAARSGSLITAPPAGEARAERTR